MPDEPLADYTAAEDEIPEPAEEERSLLARVRLQRSRIIGLAALAVLLVLVAWLAWTWVRWPDVAMLRNVNPVTTAFIEMYRSAEHAEDRSGEVSWSPVPYDRISPNLKRAVVASEDTEFFFHDGFSSHEMREAIKEAIREHEAPRGASTITQQLAKNLWLTPRRSLTRKFREVILTKQLEKELSKERILDLYLNVVEFGPGIYGAEAASRRYFGVSAADLTPRQGAMLAASLPRPKSWNPSSDSQYYARRVDRILEIEGQLDYLEHRFGPAVPGRLRVAPPEAEVDPSRALSPPEQKDGAPRQ